MIQLDANDRGRLQRALADIRVKRSALQKAKRAGLDVTAVEAELDRAEALAKGILREYGSATAAGSE